MLLISFCLSLSLFARTSFLSNSTSHTLSVAVYPFSIIDLAYLSFFLRIAYVSLLSFSQFLYVAKIIQFALSLSVRHRISLAEWHADPDGT